MLARVTGLHLSHTSRALRELAEKGLVKCGTPKATKNRFYEITRTGKDILKQLPSDDSGQVSL